jgi:hypothetical protein
VGLACIPQPNHTLGIPLIEDLNVKHFVSLLAVLLSGLVCFVGAGCSKKDQIPAHPKTPEEAILTLRQSLATAPKEVQDILYNQVDNGIRYGRTQEAIAGLEKIAADPSLNEQQKKLATEVAGMLKAKLATPANP